MTTPRKLRGDSAPQPVQARRILSNAEALDGLALSQTDIDTLNAIAAGLPVRGGQLALAAIRTKLEYRVEKPAQRHDVRAVSASFQNPYGGTISWTPRDALDTSAPPAELEPAPASTATCELEPAALVVDQGKGG